MNARDFDLAGSDEGNRKSGHFVQNGDAPGGKVLFVTSEIADFVQTGGLGEVSAALPRALQGLCDVRVLIPGYRQVLEKQAPIDVVGTGSFIPDDWHETYATADIVAYDGEARVKVGREFLLRAVDKRQAELG